MEFMIYFCPPLIWLHNQTHLGVVFFFNREKKNQKLTEPFTLFMSPDYFNMQTRVNIITLASDTWGQHKVVLEVCETILLALFSNKYYDKASNCILKNMQGGAKNKVYSSHHRKESKMPVSQERPFIFSPGRKNF